MNYCFSRMQKLYHSSHNTQKNSLDLRSQSPDNISQPIMGLKRHLALQVAKCLLQLLGTRFGTANGSRQVLLRVPWGRGFSGLEAQKPWIFLRLQALIDGIFWWRMMMKFCVCTAKKQETQCDVRVWSVEEKRGSANCFFFFGFMFFPFMLVFHLNYYFDTQKQLSA